MANPYFNAAYYLANNQDVVLAGVTEETAELHYDLHGAGEGRAPNSWFDAEAYLLSNTDLIPGGVTLSTALLHFATHGVYEGRIFNNNPALAPSNFEAANYAETNPDVAEALEIEDPENPTAEEAALLLSHFLAHGLVEGRTGAGAAFEEAAQTAAIVVDPTEDDVTVGTSGNDTFTWDVGATASTASVNGLAGTDTLKISNAAGAVETKLAVASVENVSVTGSANLNVTGAGVQTLALDGGAVTYTGKNVESVSVKGGVTANLLLGATGAADVLSLSVTGAGNTVSADGFEQVNVAFDSKTAAATAIVNSNKVTGDSLVYNLSGGSADGTVGITVGSTGSGKLESVTIDGSEVAGKLGLTVASLGNLNAVTVVDVNVVGGAKADTIDFRGIDIADFDPDEGNVDARIVTIDAGAGDDAIFASEAIDVITGGAGADTFTFTAATAQVALQANEDEEELEIAAVDSITDFKAADNVSIAGLAVVEDLDEDVGTVSQEGVLTFATGVETGLDLTEIVQLLDGAVEGANAGVLFNFDGSAYLFFNGAAGDDPDAELDFGLIELAGVNANSLEIVDNGVVFAA